MNIIQKIFGGESKEKAMAEAMIRAFNAGTRVNTVQSLGWNTAIYSYADTESAFKQAFTENAIYYSVVDRIADKFGHIPRYVYKPEATGRKYRKKALDENIADNDLMRLLLNPNDLQGQDEFFYLCAVSYITTGECFIWKNRGGIEGGKPVELYVLPPWCVTIVPDGQPMQPGIAGYRVVVGANSFDLAIDDVITWQKPQLALLQDGGHLRGFAPMRAQNHILTQAGSITDASVAMYKTGGARGVLVNEGLDNISPEQQDEIKRVVNSKMNGTDAKGTIAAIQGAWKYFNLGQSSVDMNLMEADDAITKKICFSLGFPAELYQSDSTFANKEQAWLFFITNTLMPLTARFDGALNKGLVKDFGERGVWIASDYSDLPEMAAIRANSAKALQNEWMVTPNEKRAALGYEPLEDAAMDKVYVPSGLTPIDQMDIGLPLEDNTEL